MLIAQSSQSANPLVTFAPLLLLGVVFYFLLIRPQQRRARAQQSLLRSIEVGDEVVTGGGIFGHVVDIDEDEDVVTLQIADGVQIKIMRGGIGRKIEAWDEDEDEDDDEHETNDGVVRVDEPHEHETAAEPIAPDQPQQSKDL
jgi:preprotein translocase subunit YajC